MVGKKNKIKNLYWFVRCCIFFYPIFFGELWFQKSISRGMVSNKKKSTRQGMVDIYIVCTLHSMKMQSFIAPCALSESWETTRWNSKIFLFNLRKPYVRFTLFFILTQPWPIYYKILFIYLIFLANLFFLPKKNK